ncbi:Acyl-CoA N-acyltransferase [Pleurostoma richardsiae]|uniref:Acyl-CoA N-acyltransferase n=1 Tax=Pleurostoma richardsiae TaxID=41990 RepID=A0AA38R1L3_9PEZI|nr:Acyl-CoA N-acyltransferase [Pleurostoma richardsiae]
MASSTPTLDSLTEADLQRLFTANTAAGTPSVRLAGGARKVHIPGTASAYAWASENPLHNGVTYAVLAPGDDPVRAVRAVTQEGLLLAGSGGKAAGLCHWVLGPVPQPELEQVLLENGFVLHHEEPAMAAPLEEDEEEMIKRYEHAVARVGEGFGVTPVEEGDAKALADWMTAWGAETKPVEVVESWKSVYEGMLRELPRSEFSMFVGRVHGRPAGAGIMFRAEGVAAVHYIATLPEFRRRGIGAALTLHAMMLARRFGCRIAMLTATEIGKGVYRSLGFREFGQQRTYLWDGNVEFSLERSD